MANRRSITLAASAIAAIAFAASAALAQDPVKVAPDTYKVVTENQYVRVLDVHLKPAGKSAMHSHPGYVAVALTACKVRFTSADGKTQVVDFKPGEPSWRDAESHSAENIGTSECHALNIEVKSAAEKSSK